MTRILLVEDDDGKREALVNQIEISAPEASITKANSLISALKEIKSSAFDVIVLDITLPYRDISPTRPPGDMHKLGGQEVMRQMKRFGLSAPVIVVSQFDTFGDEPDVRTFEQLIAELAHTFPKLFRTGIYYHASLSDWNEHLDRALKSILETNVE